MMKKNPHRRCPPGRRPKKPSYNKKIGMVLLLIGIVAVLSLILPLQGWIFLLSATIIVCGVILVRRQ